jgi:hypothetical protein
MNLRIFISILVIAYTFSASSFSAQNLKAVAVSGGEESSLVVAENGWVFSAGNCPGRSEDNSFGRVFAGEMNTASGFLENIIGVGAGWVHALVLTSDGQALAWGFDTVGELGNGIAGASDYPVWVHAGQQNSSNQDANLSSITCVAAGKAELTRSL